MNNIEEILANRAKHLPPKDVSDSELIRKLISVEPPSEVLGFPRYNEDGTPLFEFRMRVLTQQEIDECGVNAERHARDVLAGKAKGGEDIKAVRAEAWEEIFINAKLVELLYLACREKDDVTKTLFVAPSRMRKILTQDELAALFSAYQSLQFKFGPLWRVLTDDEVDAWVEKLVGGMHAYPLSQLPPGQLVQLVLSLAYRLAALKTGTCSHGSQSEDTTLGT